MKKQVLGKIIIIIGAMLVGLFCLGLLADPKGEYSTIFWCAVAGVSLGAILIIVGFLIVVPTRRVSSKNTENYKAYQPVSSLEYGKELQTVRKNFNADTGPKKNQIAYVYYPRANPFYDYDVIASGKIYYAYVIEAHDQLFQEKNVATITQPAVVIYSTEQYFENNPLELRELAVSLANKPVVNIWAKMILRKPTECFSSIQIPQSLTDGHEMYLATVMVYRNHLPLGYLVNNLLPIIADPLSSASAFVVDVKYWTQPLIGNFVNGCNKKIT